MGKRHIHIDPLGGLAGDMFVAAMADAFPERVGDAVDFIRALGWPDGLKPRLFSDNDGVLSGMRLSLDMPATGPRTYSEMDADLLRRNAPPEITALARAMLLKLAEAESAIHEMPVANVHFHEIAGWDTLVDFMLAAYFIHESGAATWSIGPLPRGNGNIRTAHGLLPVPAPATLRLLRGFEMIDDGVGGERVTPTGAAIVAVLGPTKRSPRGAVERIGYGFGTRRLPGMSNVTRVTSLDATSSSKSGVSGQMEQIAVLAFEVDDQTAEDLAVALDRLRSLDGVLDVCQSPVIGKKGRLASHIQVLAREPAKQTVAESCVLETRTLGVRIQIVDRLVLERRMETLRIDDTDHRIKISALPDGSVRRKADMDDRAGQPGYERREALRQRAEAHFIKDKIDDREQ